MKSHRTIATSVLFAAGAGTLAHGQAADDIPIRYIRPMANTVSVGVRLTQSSSTVQFSNLGSIPRSAYVITADSLKTNGQVRRYDNGVVSADQKVGDVATNETGVNAIDNTSIYVYNNRPVAESGGTAKGVYTNQLNPIGADGRMVVTILDYKKKTTADGVPYFPVTKTVDGVEVTTYEVQYERDASGNLIPETITGGYLVPHSNEYTRFWIGNQGSVQNYDADGKYTGYTLGTQYVYDSSGRAVGVNMDIYSAASAGVSREVDMGSGTGFELSFERTIRRESLRFEWGFKSTLGISGINGKTSGNVSADLVTLRQTYSTVAAFPYIPTDPSVYDISAYRPITTVAAAYNNYQRDGNGNVVLFDVVDANGTVTGKAPRVVPGTIPSERTIPLSLTPNATADGTYTTVIRNSGQANIRGAWQVKGAYYMVRLGPSARFYFSPRLSVSATAGLGIAYYASRFNIDETLVTTLTANEIAFRTADMFAPNGRDPFDNSKKGVTLGPVGEVNAELWITARTGIYAGVAYEKLGQFSHQIGEQKAAVKLGTGTTFRFGVNTRF